MRRVFSGIQPSGEMHIGNWLGAIRNYVALQDDNECLYCVVDQHAITGNYDAATLGTRTREMAISLLAAGVDPSRAVLFVQSHVPQHTTLAWLLSTIAPLGDLERMTQFKDKSGRMESIPAGLLTYPVLMAADILVYRAEAVPVGEDQLQHLELAREIARRWNAAFGDGTAFFPEPQPILSPARRIVGLDGQAKMSKSLGNTIGVMESPEAIWQKLRVAMTDPARVTKSDPGTPEICNVYALHQHFSPPDTVEEVAVNCRTAAWGCIDCKKVLAANMTRTLAPMRERGLELRGQPGTVTEILGDGAVTARARAEATLAEVTARMGFLPEE
ncbi:MAG: tryptophan--tRNA ligase [Gemmatimonadota bacterium]